MKRIILIGLLIVICSAFGCTDKLQMANDICSENNMTLGKYNVMCAECHIVDKNIAQKIYYIEGNKDDYILKEGTC